MITSKSQHEAIEWNRQSQFAWRRYRPIRIFSALFILTLASDIFLANALARESYRQWFWGISLILCLTALIASLRSDSFKLLRYVVDHTGVHLQYEIAKGPLEPSELLGRTQGWTGICSAAYSTLTDEDGSKTHDGVVLTLKRPLESGRTIVKLQSEQPEQLMSVVLSHLDPIHAVKGNVALALAIV